MAARGRGGSEDEDSEGAQYLIIDTHELDKLRVIKDQLHGGTDRERDYGHRIDLIIRSMELVPAERGDTV